MPEGSRFAPALVNDPIGDRLLVLGGARSSSDAPTSFVVSALSADGSTTSTVATTGGGPSGRVRHSAIVVGHEVIVVGGSADGFAAGAAPAESDVWALDLGTLAWRRVGSLSEPRMSAALRVQSDGHLWVIGGWSGTDFVGTGSAESIDLATGASSAIAVPGAWPPSDGGFNGWTSLGDGILGIDLGGTVDEAGGQFWRFIPDGAAAAHWASGDACTSDYALVELVGVPDAGADGWLVGASNWHFAL